MAEKDVDGLEELLFHRETEAERLRWLGREDTMPGLELRADPPPLAPIRNCAEWEPCSGVLIRYPLGLPYNLLRDLDDDVILHVVVSSGYLSTAQSNLTANGVDMGRVEFLVRSNDSIWTRDYGPWFVFDGNDELTIINHTYNRPYRPNDNLIPLYFGQQQGIPVVGHDMYHTGGNYMTDGAHISSSTELVYDEAAAYQGMTEAQVDQLMEDYYGITNYEVLEYIESGGIHHIDTWAKFLDEESVLVKEVWSSHWTYSTLEQRATLLASLPASTDRNYQVFRVYCYDIGGSSPASYTNSLILNDNIYVPFFGNSSYDDDAIAAYEAAAPGYTVRGYYYSGFLSDDALHCRAKGVMDQGMLRVAHVPVLEDQMGDVTITASIHAHSNQPLTAVELHYRQDAGDWEIVPMTAAGGDGYEGVIPLPVPVGQSRGPEWTTDYYIHVEDASGRQAGMPRVEPTRWYSFTQSLDLSAAGETELAPVTLLPNYPNPFNPSTTFNFELRFPDRVELTVIDARGGVVCRLAKGDYPAGQHQITWDGRNDSGRTVATGVYLFRLRAAGLQYTRPATLIK
ncbi:MAG: agmatine deiminase family protein [bacterium]